MHTFALPKSKLNMFKGVAMFMGRILSGIITGRGFSHITSMQEHLVYTVRNMHGAQLQTVLPYGLDWQNGFGPS